MLTFGGSLGSRLVETVGRVFGRAQEQRALPADLLESDDEFLAVFDAPGAHAADVQVKYEDDAVVVRVDRFREFYDGFDMRFPGRGLTLDGRVELPGPVDPRRASANLHDDGTLHVRVPKAEPDEDVADEKDAEDPADGENAEGADDTEDAGDAEDADDVEDAGD